MNPEIVVTQASPKDEDALKYIIKHSSHATIFHTPEWNQLVSEEFKIPHYTLLARKKSTPVGMYTFFIQSTPTRPLQSCKVVSPLRDADSIYGGPIAIEQNEDALSKLIMKVKSSSNLQPVLEYYQICTPPGYPIELLQKFGYKCVKLLTCIVNLQISEQNLWNKLESKRRNLVRKAQSTKLKLIAPLSNSSFIEIYYPMLSEVFEKSGKKPIQKSYYKHIISELSPQKMG